MYASTLCLFVSLPYTRGNLGRKLSVILFLFRVKARNVLLLAVPSRLRNTSFVTAYRLELKIQARSTLLSYSDVESGSLPSERNAKLPKQINSISIYTIYYLFVWLSDISGLRYRPWDLPLILSYTHCWCTSSKNRVDIKLTKHKTTRRSK